MPRGSADVLRGIDVAYALPEEAAGAVGGSQPALDRRRDREVAVDLTRRELELEDRRIRVVPGRRDRRGVDVVSPHVLRLRRPRGALAPRPGPSGVELREQPGVDVDVRPRTEEDIRVTVAAEHVQ